MTGEAGKAKASRGPTMWKRLPESADWSPSNKGIKLTKLSGHGSADGHAAACPRRLGLTRAPLRSLPPVFDGLEREG